MSDNLKYGLTIGVAVALAALFVVYVWGRQDECTAKGGTLVRVPIGIGWNCVKTVGHQQ